MSFSTYYKYDGELKHIAKNHLEDELNELKQNNDRLWDQILILMAMSPAPQSTENGYCQNWPDFIQERCSELREEIEINSIRISHLDDAIVSQMLDPNSVHDDNDEWDEVNQCFKNS